ncbi:MAG TPA: TIGR04086 family membrane protein, partial [Syntrophomonas sp.]|nr:TIGR04086 family membrane protein [Syntrophomonas sp.]
LGIVACLAAALVLYFSALEETSAGWIAQLIVIGSVFYAGCHVSKSYGNKGLIRGLTMGIIYYIILLIASLVFQTGGIDIQNYLINLLICLAAGGFGGILGIGLNAE